MYLPIINNVLLMNAVLTILNSLFNNLLNVYTTVSEKE